MPQAISRSPPLTPLSVILGFRPVLITLLLSASCIAQQNSEYTLQYFTDLNTALREATQREKRVMLYTGTAHHLRGRTPREYFVRLFVEHNTSVQKALADWLI